MGCAMLRQNPDLYSGLVLFHSTAAADSTEKKANRDKVKSFVRENGVKTFLDSFVPSLFHKKDKENMDFALKIAQKTTESTFLTYTQAMRDRLESETLLLSSKVPIMILAGAQDALIPLESLQNQSKLNTSIELQVLERITVPIETDDYAAFGAAPG